MRNRSLFYGSSYDRGLDVVLKLYPKILEKYPNTTLHICYGWELFDKGYADNPERMEWKERISKHMKQKGITHHGRVGKNELKKIRQTCGIWVYPTYFTEINCITALEAQQDGLVPVTMDFGALKETVGAGFKIVGDIYDEEVQEEWLKALFTVMGSKKIWNQESKKAKKFASNYSWDIIANEWKKYL